MKALFESLILYLMAVGGAILVGPGVGWMMLSLKRRLRFFIGGSVCVFAVFPLVLGVSGPLQAFMVVAWLTAIATSLVLALIGRHVARCQRLLDALAARVKSR